MTREDLRKSPEYRLHHTALERGYVSRKLTDENLVAYPYDGKYGKGYTVSTPSWESTRYNSIEYWVEVPSISQLIN